MRGKSKTNHWPYLATLVIIAALWADAEFLRPTAAVAAPYHARIRLAVADIPANFGSWVGLETPVPEAAVRILHPNVIVSRRYQNLQTGERISFLLVQVADARDILGHYPPVCYPAQGWINEGEKERDWPGRDLVRGREYEFTRNDITGSAKLVVANFLFLPDGRTCRGMSEVETAAQSRLQKLFGAGQVQIVFEAIIPTQRRAEIVSEFIELVAPVRELHPLEPE